MKEWFCLKDDKENFNIFPERDQAFLFGKAQWRNQIDEKLELSIVLKEPVRLVWWGDYGIGKTHRLEYMKSVIEREKLAFFPITVVCRDLTTKSGFDALHYDLVNNIGFAEVRNLVASYKKRLEKGDPSVIPFSKLSSVQDVTNAMDRVGDQNDQLATTAWRFLAGLELKTGELPLANVTKERIDSSVEYASVLRCIAAVIQAETGKQLLFLIDQMETLTNIVNRDFENAWVETLRAVLDIRELGVICTIGAVRVELMPAIMQRPEVLSRFKQDNYIRLVAYEHETAEAFLKDLLSHWIDTPRRDEVVKLEKLNEVPGYDPDVFPFTNEAFSSFCNYLTNDPRDAKPREFLERLNRVAAQACRHKARLITKTELEAQGIHA
jgi:hypothetical protein